jgi:C1A family cysteine protease
MKNLLILFLMMMTIININSKSSDVVNSSALNNILENYQTQAKKEVFKAYHQVFQKEYDLNSEQGILRYKIFKENLKFIEETNSKNLSFKLGIGPFTDMTNEEFKEKYLMKTQDLFEMIRSEPESDKYVEVNRKIDFNLGQTKYDYTSNFRSAVSQGICGSCWAFATNAGIEGNYHRSFGDYIALSSQQLVDCDNYDGGCNGGWPTNALNYIKEKGVIYDAYYPYISNSSGTKYTCNYSTNLKPNFILDNWEQCSLGNCDRSKILSMLSRGPLIGVMDGEGNGYLKDYKSGILDIPCSNINHAINIIGVDSDSVGGFYIGRNSWGKFWGENGNFRIRFNNTTKSCLMDSAAWRPVVKKSIYPVPPTSNCLKLYSSCGFQGTSQEVCQSSPNFPNYNLVTKSIFLGKASKYRFFNGEKCRGSSFTWYEDISCLDDVNLGTFTIKSALIDWDNEKPPSGCIWVYDGFCFTQQRKQFCNNVLNLSEQNINIASIRLASDVSYVTIYTETEYYGYFSNLFSKDIPSVNTFFENKIKSLKIIKQ